ncbi:phosphotransferase enzyme family protein [Methylomonas koyamae]|uniref:phosphotransferase enzyme family protein n=1 Tax=Methylomonas koyamae TaxID=702114 RepID=UPI000BC35A8E|nr:aminoglycoside phosphotransferase family protein [Methylomonas koyamae]ATG88746.1 aminoglycoside phosphotransferase [Methylomonas koyamae]
MNRLEPIARRFAGGRPIGAIRPLGNGLINDTFLVETDGGNFVLQAINERVFPHPERIAANLNLLSTHIGRQQSSAVRLRIPRLLPAADGWHIRDDASGRVWRALEWIAPSESRERLANPTQAAQVGAALGHFHSLCSGLAAEALHDTLPGFHIAPEYFRQYQAALAQTPNLPASPDIQRCRDFIADFAAQIGELEQAKQRGELAERVIHGDPKLNNFLFEPDSDRIIGLVDLDTVKPGLVHYDIGDCLRSCCHIPETNGFDLPRCRTILQHYLAEAGGFFTAEDYRYLYPAMRLIPFELGLRFFTDYLQGNRYFKVDDADQNLRRALAQFELVRDIERQSGAIRELIAGLTPATARA